MVNAMESPEIHYVTDDLRQTAGIMVSLMESGAIPKPESRMTLRAIIVRADVYYAPNALTIKNLARFCEIMGIPRPKSGSVSVKALWEKLSDAKKMSQMPTSLRESAVPAAAIVQDAPHIPRLPKNGNAQ